MDIRTRCNELIVKLQAAKQPLNEERVHLSARLGTIGRADPAYAEVRKQVRDMHERIAPLEQLMASINAAKKMRGAVGEKVFDELRLAAEEYFSDGDV